MSIKFCFFSLVLFILSQQANAQVSPNFSTSLPLVVINTNGKQIRDEPKVTADMKIIFKEGGTNTKSDEGNIYDGKVGIEIRGRSSASYPQTPYLFETRNEDGSNNNVSLLGMPEENDWTLLSFYNDKSFVRNILAFQMFTEMGNYAPRSRLVEVIINNEYRGIYQLCEKIKRDKNRVGIAKLKPEDNDVDEISGGYIFKIDYYSNSDSWQSPFSPINHPGFKVHFVYHDPKPDELSTQQKAYLRNYVTEFENVLYGSNFMDENSGYKAYIDDGSFIDYFLVSEVSRNNDGFKKSRYFHKDKDGKIVAGPVWDFDWAWKNINECYIFKARDGSGWSYKVNDCNPWVKSPGWMVRLFYDSNFKNNAHCRYNQLRESVLSKERIFGVIDSVANLVDGAKDRHFQKWDILGRNVGAPEVDAQPNTYAGEVQKIKAWISTRLNWLDKNMLGECLTTDSNSIFSENLCKVFPNPATDFVRLETSSNIKELFVYDYSGRLITSNGSTPGYFTLNIKNYKPGLYFIKVVFESDDVATCKFIKR